MTHASDLYRWFSPAAGIFVLAVTSAAGAAEKAPITRVSSKAFVSTIEHLEWQLGGYGITVVSRLDYRGILENMDVSSRRSQTIEILRRSWAKVVLDSDAAAAIALPLRIYLYERDDGRTVVSYYRPSSQFGDQGNEALMELGRELDSVLEGIVRLATK